MAYDFEKRRRELEKEYESLDHTGTGYARQREITKELAALNKEEAKWKKLRAAAESVAENLLEGFKIQRIKNVKGEQNTFLYRVSLPEGKLDYESDGKSFWIMEVEVWPEFRRRGVATRLITELYRQAAKVRGTVIVGAYTQEGAQMKNMIGRIAAQFRSTVQTVDEF